MTGGRLGVFTSKTATSIVRYCRDEVVGIIDSTHAGADLEGIIGIGGGLPIFASVHDALGSVEADTLAIGVAPVGGALAPDWRGDVLAALEGALDVVAGLHVMLADDDEFAAAAAASGASIFDVRKPPDGLPVAEMRAAGVKAFRVLTVGTDCQSGKMVTALELAGAGVEAGFDSRFVATGQTGIMIAGRGIAVDRVISDFAAGAAEVLVIEDGDADVLFVEGQGSLVHPGYSGVTLSLMHGCLPQAMVLCHTAGRTSVANYEREVKLPTLRETAALYEHAMRAVWPCRVVAVALNTFRMSDDDAAEAVESANLATGLPSGDVIRFGAGAIFEAVMEVCDEVSR